MIYVDKMNTRQFIAFTLLLFVTGNLLLALIQYNSSRNIEGLIVGNTELLQELRTSNHLREIERDILWVESRIRAAIATDDISHLEGIDSKVQLIDRYLDSLKTNSFDLAARPYIVKLAIYANEKLRTKNRLLAEYNINGRMDNISMITNPQARVVSNEISNVIRKIYDGRQKTMNNLSRSVEKNGRTARFWGSVMISLIVVSGCGWFWFIVSRLQQQNKLITQLDASEKKAKEAALIKENFMANMSHEIRTPLNSILGFTNLLKMRPLDAEPREFVHAIEKSGENLLSIINDILDLSKIEAGMMRIESNPFSVRGLFHSIKTLFNERAREKNLEIRVEIDAQVPDTLIGDATRLTQILVNLICNALKFTEKGHVFVHIYNKKIDDSHIELNFSISDTGIGIERDKIACIFDRFHQAEDSTTRNYGGTGLGLCIVKDLLILQHGDIEVESDAGKGTTFRFFIPYLIAAEQFTENAEEDLNSLPVYASGAVSILVVDDNLMNQSLMKHLLNQWNLSFDIAGNGLEALILLRNKNYNLILMDIQMPGMDGYATARRIRTELQLDVPIVAMTAHALAGEREKCLSYGMNEYLSKPINERKLHNFISRFTSISENTSSPVLPARCGEEKYSTINLEYMREISRGNIGYEKQVTGQFLEIVPRSLLEIDIALLSNDFGAINHVAHDLKTSMAIMGMTEQLEDILTALEYSRDELTILQNTSLLKIIGNLALKEAGHYAELLNLKTITYDYDIKKIQES